MAVAPVRPWYESIPELELEFISPTPAWITPGNPWPPYSVPPPIPPHEIAWEALRRLVALDLVAKGQIEPFYVHLSAILRVYIENKFHVRAPELTTEEFFEAAAASPELGPYRGRLKEFLDLCDQVKFALFQPEPATIQESFDVVKKFIQETTDHGSRTHP